MTVTRLTGGLTPGDAGDPRTFPEIFNAAADVIDASEAGLSVVEGDVGTLQGDVGALQDDVVELETRGFRIVDTLYFTSSGTFTKADFPFLRAIRVKCQAAGGGGGGAATTGVGTFSAGGGGGGGGYGEKFITNIAGLDSSVTVTRGAGGTGGAIGGTGGSGGTSSFGSLVSASGGSGGNGGEGAQSSEVAFGNPGAPGTTISGADFSVVGSHGTIGFVRASNRGFRGSGGGSFLGATRGHVIAGGSTVGDPGFLFGGGGGGAVNPVSSTTGNTGGAGANGIVIIELFA